MGGWGAPEGAGQNPGLLRDIGDPALDPHVATVLLHLAQERCQQGALACMPCNLDQLVPFRRIGCHLNSLHLALPCVNYACLVYYPVEASQE